MTAATAAKIDQEQGSSPASSAPDWDLVPFDVACARCGHDLRGQCEAVCPACSLEFDWADACPIEELTCLHCGYHLYGLQTNRCPECGQAFDWDEVLLDFRRRQKDLFEYRWRDEPVRSLFRTWLRALRPKRFWQSIDIHDPPQIALLLTSAIINSALAIVAFTLLSAITSVVGFSMYYANRGQPQSFAAYVQSFRWSFQWPALASLVPVLAWWVATVGTLLLLRQSMARCRIRDVHVIRVGIYSLTFTVLPAVLTLWAVSFAWIVAIHTVDGDEPYILILIELALTIAKHWAPGALILAVILHATWSIHCAYRYYLRIPHALGVAVASQAVALIVTAIVAFWCGSRVALDLLM